MNTQNKPSSASPDLSPALNTVPDRLRHIHLMGICGTGMASLAGMLKQEGYLVTGSDQNVYPPMSEFLARLSIPVAQGYSAKNLSPVPDLVVVGNVITRKNPEAQELARLGIPYISFPQALRCFAMKGKKSIVIAGTHGKTTTSALVCWILEKAGLDPSFMVGGIPNNFQAGFKLGKGPYFVVEGDEYDTAFFDKGPKFLHYSPWVAILTGIEFDHADIYPDLQCVRESFRKFLRLIQPSGLLIANRDNPVAMEEVSAAKCPVVTYGLSDGANYRPHNVRVGEKFTHLEVTKGENQLIKVTTPLFGSHNISNLVSAVSLAEFLKIQADSLKDALRTFQGVRRRQEIRGEKRGILVIDDFAHHPTAVKETVRALRDKYPDRRLIAIFEPRSNSSRRNTFQSKYALSFDDADLIMIPEPQMMDKIPAHERFSSQALVRDLKARNLEALYFPNTDVLLDAILQKSRPGDLLLFMSNGAFDNLPSRVLTKL